MIAKILHFSVFLFFGHNIFSCLLLNCCQLVIIVGFFRGSPHLCIFYATLNSFNMILITG